MTVKLQKKSEQQFVKVAHKCLDIENQKGKSLIKVVLRPKKQFLFFFGFQNNVNWTLTDPNIKFWF